MIGDQKDSRLDEYFYHQYLEYLKATGRCNLTKLKESYELVYFWFKEHIANLLPKNKDAKILVIGCGLGHEVYALNKLGYSNVNGIDISEPQIRIAKA